MTKLMIKRHYYTTTTSHTTTTQIKPGSAGHIFETFVEQTPKHLLSILEKIWLDKLNATINVNEMLLPLVK